MHRLNIALPSAKSRSWSVMADGSGHGVSYTLTYTAAPL